MSLMNRISKDVGANSVPYDEVEYQRMDECPYHNSIYHTRRRNQERKRVKSA